MREGSEDEIVWDFQGLGKSEAFSDSSEGDVVFGFEGIYTKKSCEFARLFLFFV